MKAFDELKKTKTKVYEVMFLIYKSTNVKKISFG